MLTALEALINALNAKQCCRLPAVECALAAWPATGPDGDAEDPDQELLEYVTRNRDVPIPTYFIGGFGRGR